MPVSAATGRSPKPGEQHQTESHDGGNTDFQTTELNNNESADRGGNDDGQDASVLSFGKGGWGGVGFQEHDIGSDWVDITESDDQIRDKLERKINLDEAILNWNEQLGANDGVFDWVRLINQIDDAKLLKICGTDGALYLVFLKYSAKFFGLISIINTILMGLYATGSPLEADDPSKMRGEVSVLQTVTILNVTDTMPKVIVCFLHAMVTIIAMTVYLLVKYMNKFNVQQYEAREDDSQAPSNGRERLFDLRQIAENPQLLNDKDMGEKLYTE